MKRIIMLILVIGLFFVFNCQNKAISNNETINKRIIGIESSGYDTEQYQIIKIDGVEYISNCSGGICPLVK